MATDRDPDRTWDWPGEKTADDWPGRGAGTDAIPGGGQTTGPHPQSVTRAIPRRGRPQGWWVLVAGCGAAIVALVVVGGVAFGNRASSPTPAPTQVPAQPSATARPAETAYDFLSREARAGAAAAAAIIDSWVPQLSAKQPGTQADGIVYDYDSIRTHYLSLQRSYPDAILVKSEDYSSFTRPDYWVVVVPRVFASGDGANSWCAGEGFDRDNCFAKRLSYTGGPSGNTKNRK